jgi:hypothetical protein
LTRKRITKNLARKGGFRINTKEVENVVRDINQYLCSEMWMDFEVTQYTNYELTITGSIDPSSSIHNIEITFQDVSFVSLSFDWKTNTSIPAFELVKGLEEKELNSKFRVEQGNYIFKFLAEDYPPEFGCLIAAKKISFRITKQN